MSEFDNNMTGILSRNDRKDRDTQPDFTGNATIDGVDYFLDAWVNERKDGSGRKFFKLKFKAKDQQRMASGMTQQPTTAHEIESDEIPF
jgi:hypothetical protein